MSEAAENLDLSPLTVRQRRYVENRRAGMSFTESARAAGYSQPSTAAHRLERHPLVSAILRGHLHQVHLSAEMTIAQDSEIAKAPWQDYIDLNDQGCLVIDYQGLLADGYGFCIRSIKTNSFGQQVEFADADAARERLMRHYGLFRDRLDVTSNGRSLPPALVVLANLSPDEFRRELDTARAALRDEGDDGAAGYLPAAT